MKKLINKKINHVKQRPLEERNRYAKLAALITTGVIVLLWILIRVLVHQDEPKKLFDTSSIEQLFDNVSHEAAQIGDTISQQKDTFKEARDEYNKQKEIKGGDISPEANPIESGQDTTVAVEVLTEDNSSAVKNLSGKNNTTNNE